MPKQEFDLLEIAAALAAQPSTGSAEVMVRANLESNVIFSYLLVRTFAEQGWG
jgi:hypothetical protein